MSCLYLFLGGWNSEMKNASKSPLLAPECRRMTQRCNNFLIGPVYTAVNISARRVPLLYSILTLRLHVNQDIPANRVPGSWPGAPASSSYVLRKQHQFETNLRTRQSRSAGLSAWAACGETKITGFCSSLLTSCLNAIETDESYMSVHDK